MTRTLFIILFVILTPSAFADLIKKSRSGICHPPASPSYSKTSNYTAFDTLSACLGSGGRLPKNLPSSSSSQMDKAISEANSEGRAYSLIYTRKDWPHWKDPDNNGCDARQDALISQADGPITFKQDSHCAVISGTWVLPYSGETYTGLSRHLHADHIVPLSYAHSHGGASFTKEQKLQFANDPENLLIVTGSLNSSKSDSGPSEWMPPLNSYRCTYLGSFDAMLKKYRLQHTASEFRVLSHMHQACSLPAPYMP